MEKQAPITNLVEIDPKLSSTLLPELKIEILKRFVPLLVLNRVSFNNLNKQVAGLKTVNKEMQKALDGLFSHEFILKLADFININTDRPISFYQLGKAILNRNALLLFDQEYRKEANDLGLQIRGLPLRRVDIDTVKALIMQGANLDILEPRPIAPGQQVEDPSVLVDAVLTQNIAIVKLMIDSGANLDIRHIEDDLGPTGVRSNTALIYAAYNNLWPIVTYLAEAGANLNLQGVNSYSALSYAIMAQNIDAVRQLINIGADPHIRLCDGKSAYQHSLQFNNQEIQELLASYRTWKDKLVDKKEDGCTIS